MDSRRIVELLRATLDANQQAQANEQLQQVRYQIYLVNFFASNQHMENDSFKR